MMTPANQLLLAALPGALAAGQFEPYFQPRVDLRTGQALGAEAFGGADWRLETVVARTLADSELPGDALSFEIGEDALLAQPESARALLERLRALGPGIVLHQFSLESSTIVRVAGLPLEELKIPRGTIRALFDQGGTASIRSIVDLAHRRGLRTTAVGVESRETWRRLRGIGCDRAQGNLISKPLPGREIPRWLVGWGQQSRRQRLIAAHGRRRKSGTAGQARKAA